MAQKRKSVGEMDTTTMIVIFGGVAVLLYFMFGKQPAPVATTVIRPAAPSTSGTTAAEIAAGATVADTLINDAFSGDNS
jgi:hypothetical protein